MCYEENGNKWYILRDCEQYNEQVMEMFLLKLTYSIFGIVESFH